MDTQELAAHLLGLTDDELYATLGAELVGTSTLKDGDLDDLRQRGRNWLQRHWAELRSHICGNLNIQAIRGDRTLELLAVADFIIEQWLKQAGAMSAAAIITRFGLDKLCAGDTLS
jgi:hypothetical protein